MENWKTIEGFENYQVSDLGRVQSVKTGKILNQMITHRGYLRVGLYTNDGRQKHLRVHRLVAQAFIPNPDNKPQVNHLDEGKTNNKLSNLEWSNARDNVNHGERNKKLAKTKGKPIMQFDLNGNFIREYESTQDVMRQTGFSQSIISLAANGKRPDNKAKKFVWKFKEDLLND